MQGEAVAGKRFSTVAEYALRVLGLAYIAETYVGGEATLSHQFPAVSAQHCVSAFVFQLNIDTFGRSHAPRRQRRPEEAPHHRRDACRVRLCSVHTFYIGKTVLKVAQPTHELSTTRAARPVKQNASAALPPCRPSKVIFADEISTGLDSSTTFQIVQSFSNLAHMRKVPTSAQSLSDLFAMRHVNVASQCLRCAALLYASNAFCCCRPCCGSCCN